MRSTSDFVPTAYLFDFQLIFVQKKGFEFLTAHQNPEREFRVFSFCRTSGLLCGGDCGRQAVRSAAAIAAAGTRAYPAATAPGRRLRQASGLLNARHPAHSAASTPAYPTAAMAAATRPPLSARALTAAASLTPRPQIRSRKGSSSSSSRAAGAEEEDEFLFLLLFLFLFLFYWVVLVVLIVLIVLVVLGCFPKFLPLYRQADRQIRANSLFLGHFGLFFDCFDCFGCFCSRSAPRILPLNRPIRRENKNFRKGLAFFEWVCYNNQAVTRVTGMRAVSSAGRAPA